MSLGMKTSLKKLDQMILGFGSWKNLDEVNFVYSKLERVRSKVISLISVAGIIISTACFFLHFFLESTSFLTDIFRYTYLLIPFFIGTIYFGGSALLRQCFFVIATLLVLVAHHFAIKDLLATHSTTFDLLTAMQFIYMVSLNAILIATLFVSTAIQIPIILLIGYSSVEITSGIQSPFSPVVAAFSNFIFHGINYGLQRVNIQSHLSEMRSRLLSMPRRMALNSDQNIERPKQRFSVCLSSDWRGYQELVSGMSDESVVVLLEDYYQRTQDLLNSSLGDFDFYSDWIADELFAVIYIPDSKPDTLESRQNLLLASIAISRSICRMKSEFAYDHDLKLSIDIGLSSGLSLIGVIGPTNNRKATALGSNPGRARRLQTTGKLLRKEVSNQDRIVFGDEFLIHLTSPKPCTHKYFEFNAESTRMRNLEDTILYYCYESNEIETVKTEGAEKTLAAI